MKTSPITCCAFALLTAAATSQAQNFVLNGGFESPVIADPPSFQVYSAGQSIGAWNVTSAAVDVDTDFNWQMIEGRQSIDLSGFPGDAGAIAQNLSTSSGQQYKLSFYLAGNLRLAFTLGGPDLSPIKQVSVLWDGNIVDTLSFDVTGKTETNMGWELHQYTLTGGGNDVLSFIALADTGGYGPEIDAVSVTAVPEPSAYAVVSGLGLLGFATWSRRQR